MHISRKRFVALWMATICAGASTAIAQKRYIARATTGEITQGVLSELWREPRDIRSEDLLYGGGGKEDEPHGPFTFVKEDLDGSNPKFDVRDEEGVKWKIKLGAEARPETVASRFVWAVGYHADEDYFLKEVHVTDMPARVHRGHKLIGEGGLMRNARLKRTSGEKKEGIWSWRDNPFNDTRELYGLRVMMAVMNNWDLKDENNAIRNVKRADGTVERVYEVSDLGASFGSEGLNRTHDESKGNLHAYERSKFITRIEPEFVDFNVPRRPALVVLVNPHEFFSRLKLRGIGRNIPRQDARWIGDLLGQLSHDQVRDAFRSGGYEGAELNGFVSDFEARIAALRNL